MSVPRTPRARMICCTYPCQFREQRGRYEDQQSSQGKDAPASARPLSPSLDCEVVAVAKRRSITNADKRRIVLAAAACTKPGEIGALMRREGVYSSALAAWRRQYAAGELNRAEAKKRGPKAAPARDEPRWPGQTAPLIVTQTAPPDLGKTGGL